MHIAEMMMHIRAMHEHDVPDDPSDEIDVQLDDDGGELPDLEDSECLGSYESISEYLRAMLEPEVSPGCAWILEHLDYEAVLRRWESDGSRLVSDRGRVYRVVVRPGCGGPLIEVSD